VISLRSRGVRRAALVLFAIALLPTLWLGMRTYRSLLVLHSAYEAGAPATSSIRGWMTLPYIAATYHTSEAALRERLAPPIADSTANLRSLAKRAGISPRQYIELVQRAIAAATPANNSAPASEPSGWLASTRDAILTQLLVYGLPVLGLTLFLGAIGAPLPDGIATAVAGSLAGQGRLDWGWVIAVVVTASVLGDLVGYAVGRLLGREVLQRHGHWIGYTAARRSTVQALFGQWGMLTVFITRTFVSYLSSVASLLAGIAHYHLPRYLGVAIAGRLIWTAAYLGLGYAVGADLEAASGFLTNLSLLLLLVTVLAASAVIAFGPVPPPHHSAT
jgi:membrane-associated protein